MINETISTDPHSAGFDFLSRYAAKPLNTSWQINNKTSSDGITIYDVTLILKSFPFTKFARSKFSLVPKNSWKHTLFIYVPERIKSNIFFMKAGSGNLEELHKPNMILSNIAKLFGTICIEAFDIPNQPLVFNNEIDGLIEDELMAHSWKDYVNTGNMKNIVNFHMAKSIIEIMKFSDEFVKSELNININNKYILYGASKRALAIWLASSVSDKIEAIVPAVYDVLNVRSTIPNQKNRLGKFSQKLISYVKNGLFKHKLAHRLFDFIDPINYDSHILIPKFLINAANDNFFTPDSSTHYFDLIRGTKYLRYIPNVDHYLETDALQSHLVSIFKMVLGKKFIQYDISKVDNVVTITTNEQIDGLKIWYAENDVFDFGIDQFVPYDSVNIDHLIPKPGDVVEIPVDNILTKNKKWMVYMVEITFSNSFVVTSPVYVY